MNLPNPPWPPFEAPAEPELRRRQESVLVVLNLTVLAGIAVAFLVFGGVGLAGPPGKVFFAILMAWFPRSTRSSATTRNSPRAPRTTAAGWYTSSTCAA
ncbi:MAG: hypothetical protein IPP07_27385 [Holophagales bacterium]|nr:hypothetical protein [Holophagales bacterium]